MCCTDSIVDGVRTTYTKCGSRKRSALRQRRQYLHHAGGMFRCFMECDGFINTHISYRWLGTHQVVFANDIANIRIGFVWIGDALHFYDFRGFHACCHKLHQHWFNDDVRNRQQYTVQHERVGRVESVLQIQRGWCTGKYQHVQQFFHL